MSERETISLRAAILGLFRDVGRGQDRSVQDLHDDTLLTDTGLDSLCFAIVVARLEDTLGVDPFSAAEEVPFPTTVGEFVALYERALI